MSASLGGSRQSQSSNNNASMAQFVNPVQNAALANLYNVAAGVFQQNQGNSGQATANAQNVFNTAMPAWQQQLNGGAYSSLGIGDNLMSSLNQTLNTPSNTQSLYAQIMGGRGNNYADAMKASYIGDANRAADNMMRTLDARATGSGMSGGSRHGLATAQGYYDINSNLQHELAKTGYDTFDKDLANKMQIATQADNNTLARQQLMSEMLGNQNNTAQSALNFGSNMQSLNADTMAPSWQNASMLANIIGTPVQNSQGTSSGSSKGKGTSINSGASIT